MPKSKGSTRGTRGKADDRVLRLAMGAMGAGLMVGAILAPNKPDGGSRTAAPRLHAGEK
jgi:hypothetical protein